MPNFWITLEVPAESEKDARDFAEGLADFAEAMILSVDQEPPQGSLVVGKFWDDEDAR